MDYKIEIMHKTQENSYFRQVLLTGKNSQVVVMDIKPGEDIGLETHDVDQILIFTQGTGQAVINNKKYSVQAGDLFLVPAGTEHNFINTGPDNLKLFTVYAPPHHAYGTIHKTKQEALASDEHY